MKYATLSISVVIGVRLNAIGGFVMLRKFSAIVVSALIGASFCLTASAADAPPAKKEAAQKSAPKLAMETGAKTRSRASEDARECLALATNTEIIKCAEKYR